MEKCSCTAPISKSSNLSRALYNQNGKIPLSEPLIQGNEWKYIKECLDTNWVSSSGHYVNHFEKIFAGYLGIKYAVACINGTAALHIALLVAGVKPEEEVLIPALSFVAPANAIRYVRAWPVFMDVDPLTWQMDPQRVQEFLKDHTRYHRGRLINKITGKVIKAILPIHILGHSVDMDPILSIARKYNLKVIEDATESLGALYKGRPVGSLGDIACFSFNGNKIITTGGGGMITTNNSLWAERARYLTTQAKDDSVESIHNEIGYNYRLSNIQAAMGVAQMEKLKEYIEFKRKIAIRYNEKFNTLPLMLPKEASWAKSTFWLYTVVLNTKNKKMNRQFLWKELSKNGIESRPLWYPTYRLKPYRDCFSYKISIVDSLYEKALSLPGSVGLTRIQQDRVIRLVKEIMGHYL